MDFRTHRPQRHLGRSERSLVKIDQELARFLTKAQRSLTFETLHLSNRTRETLAHILVEFAEDLHQDIGVWSSLEHYNLEFFGTKLPCILLARCGDGRRTDQSRPRSVPTMDAL